MRWLTFILLLLVMGTYAQTTDKYISGSGAGFGETVEGFGVKLTVPEKVCAGDNPVLTAWVDGVGDYLFSWYRLPLSDEGAAVAVAEGYRENTLEIRNITPAHSGRYYCLVRNLEGTEVSSDTLAVEVFSVGEIRIQRPASDTVVCAGSVLTLRPVPPSSDVVYYWKAGGQVYYDSLNLVVSAEKSGDYIFTGTKGGCYASDTVHLEVKGHPVYLPLQVSGLKGEEIKIHASDRYGLPLPSTEAVKWWGAGNLLGTGNPLLFSPAESMRVWVDYTSGDCVVSDTTDVKVYSREVYSGGENDGFGETVEGFGVKLTVPEKVCAGDHPVLTAWVDGAGDYGFSWYRLPLSGEGAAVAVAEGYRENTLEIRNITPAHSGRYYCLVRNLEGTEVSSDTLAVEVFSVGEIRIQRPASDTVVCAGSVLTFRPVPPSSDVVYYWKADGQLYYDSLNLVVSAEKSGDYIFTGTKGGCYASDTVHLEVKGHPVYLPLQVSGLKGEEVSIHASDRYGLPLPSTEAVKWWGAGTLLGTGNPLLFSPAESMRVWVDYTSGDCVVSDTTDVKVYAREVYNGGGDDGFGETAESFGVTIQITPEVCENAPAEFSVGVKGTGYYTYQWLHLPLDTDEPVTAVSTDSAFVLPHAELTHEGRYFCLVTGSDGIKVSSDTLVLHVNALDGATIVSPLEDTTVCWGAELTLQGTAPLAGNNVQWRIGRKIYNQTSVTLRAEETVSCIFMVNSGGCYSFDTLKLTVEGAEVKLPADLSVLEEETVQLVARGPKGQALPASSAITWWSGERKLGEGNPFTFIAAHDSLIRVEYATGTCVSSAETQVRTNGHNVFDGGSDDGYAQTWVNFGVEVSAPKEVCLGEAAYFRAMVKGTEDYRFRWWKVGNPDLLMSDSSSFVIEAAAPEDDAEYFCEVADRYGETIYTPAERLVVNKGGEARILLPSQQDTTICVGESLVLTAAPAMGTVKWKGGGRLYYRNQLAVAPEKTTTYVLSVGSYGCYSSDTVTIHVVGHPVFLPTVVEAGLGDEVVVTARDINGNALESSPRVTWWKGEEQIGTYNPLHWRVEKDTVIQVDYADLQCLVSASTRIQVKEEGSFRGGMDDGFAEWNMLDSLTQVYISGGKTVCYGEQDTLRLRQEGGSGICRVWIYRASDNTEAYELMPTGYPLTLSQENTDIVFQVQHSDTYYIGKVETATGYACKAEGEAIVSVRDIPALSFSVRGNSHIGICDSVDLLAKLRPAVDGIFLTEENGLFEVDGRVIAGKWWEKDSLTTGWHTVDCIYTDEIGCSNRESVRLYVDSLPQAEMLLPEYRCEGATGRQELTLSFSSQKVSFVLERIRQRKYPEEQRAVVSEISVGNGIYTEPVNFAANDSLLIYRLREVKDEHGCAASVGPDTDTVWYRPRPQLRLQLYDPETAQWQTLPEIEIQRGDSVALKAELAQGTPPWTLSCGDSAYRVNGTDTILYLKEEGRYGYQVADSYCQSVQEDTVRLRYVVNGFVCLRALLGGPFDFDMQAMVSGIEDKLPLYGIDRLPSTGQMIIDWMVVELRKGSVADSVAVRKGDTEIIARDTCLLLADGKITDRWGKDTIGIPNAYTDGKDNRYYVVLKHRNHLAVMSKKPVSFVNTPDRAETCDFRDSSQVYYLPYPGLQMHMTKIETGGKRYWAMSAGEFNANDLITLYETNEVYKSVTSSGGRSYHVLDLNFDGQVDWPGWGNTGSSGQQDWLIVRRNRHQYSEIK